MKVKVTGLPIARAESRKCGGNAGCAPLCAQQVGQAESQVGLWSLRGAVIGRFSVVLVFQVLREDLVVWHHLCAQLASQLSCSQTAIQQSMSAKSPQ